MARRSEHSAAYLVHALPEQPRETMFSNTMYANRYLLLLALVLLAARPAPADTPVALYAAASLSSALQELLPRARFPDVRLSFASSSTLAKQIEAGAPADIYLSANALWMDYLQQRALIDSSTRVDLLSNALVFIAPTDRPLAIDVRHTFDLAGAFAGRIALADPSHVPAGIYARQALQRLGWWNALEQRLAPSPDVRAALAYVSRGECVLGMVYATDAAIASGVRIVATLPDSLHDAIRYPAALVSGRDRPAVRHLFNHIRSAEAQALFRRHGFTAIDEEPRAQP